MNFSTQKRYAIALSHLGYSRFYINEFISLPVHGLVRFSNTDREIFVLLKQIKDLQEQQLFLYAVKNANSINIPAPAISMKYRKLTLSEIEERILESERFIKSTFLESFYEIINKEITSIKVEVLEIVSQDLLCLVLNLEKRIEILSREFWLSYWIYKDWCSKVSNTSVLALAKIEKYRFF
jgi:hypothetical protein